MEASGELLLTILASLAQGESESISHNVRLGIRYGFQQGKPKLNSTNFLGYDTPKPHTLAINPEQAKLVRRIYRLYLEGLSPDKIARKLTSDLKKANKTFKAIKISKKQGPVTVKKIEEGSTASIYSKITVNEKNGQITLKKGNYKAGTYKLKLEITAAGNKNYMPKTVTKTVKIVIK